MNTAHNPIARKDGLVIQEVPDEVLVYDLENNKAHCLNKTAAAVWRACDGSRSITEIAGFVGAEIGGRVSDDMVWLAIDQLGENDLLEQQLKADFAGQSRREVLKKIGLAAVVAVPLVASLAAPQSALAVGSCVCTQFVPCPRGCPVNCNTTTGFCS